MKKIWVGLIVLIILAGLGSYIYFTYKPINPKEYVNVSISAEYEDTFIKTGVLIEGYELNTSSSYEILKVEKKIITVKNINLEDQNFYEQEIKVNLTEDTRIDIILEKPILPTIDVDYGENLIVNVESSNFKDVKFCIKGSLNYLFIETNYTKIKKLDDFEDYDVCYDGDFSLINSKEIIEVSYSELGNPTDLDYIKIAFIDSQGNQLIQTIK